MVAGDQILDHQDRLVHENKYVIVDFYEKSSADKIQTTFAKVRYSQINNYFAVSLSEDYSQAIIYYYQNNRFGLPISQETVVSIFDVDVLDYLKTFKLY